MQPPIYLLIGLVIGFLIGQKRGEGRGVRDEGVINLEQIRLKHEHLQRVLEMAREKSEIANDDIEKALGVSDSTAQRYLQELEAQGKLQQIGQRGKNVVFKVV